MFAKKKKKISRECWSLDYSFILWLNEHLPVYLADADRFIDLTYYTFQYKGETYTQKELLIKLINIVHILKQEYFNYDEKTLELWEAMLDIFKILFPVLWW